MTRQHPARPTRLLTLGVLAVVANPIAAQDEGLDFFEKKIRPVLVQHCYKCHSAKAGKAKAGLFLDRRAGWEMGGENGPVILPGKPEESRLLTAIRFKNNDLRLHDHLPLLNAHRSSDHVIHLMVVDKFWSHGTTRVLGIPKLGPFRCKFLKESILDLRQNLQRLNSALSPGHGVLERAHGICKRHQLSPFPGHVGKIGRLTCRNVSHSPGQLSEREDD